MKLNNRVIIVTGASGGIGLELSKLFISEGATVIGFDLNSDTLISARKKLGENFLPEKINITDSDSVSLKVKEIYEKFGKIDVLVNNAGVTKDNFSFIMKDEDFDFVVDINLKGTFIVTKYVSKYMRKNKNGVILNVSSVVGIDGNPGQINYSASKAGVIGMTKTLAKELTLKGENIRVNAIAPGFIETAMTDKLSDDLRKQITEKIPMKRLGKTEDIAKLVLFLVSDDSSYITGQIIRIDGGLTI
ncbi:MAG: beta-ketoacyl-ACP reductase [Thermotogae bacterium]|nr:beta-ketoacyl-ACP reductase [Thermotogota bacterium]HOO73773.1 beta-ketoacyl-ACP reductase [Tepiditoga sp.]